MLLFSSSAYGAIFAHFCPTLQMEISPHQHQLFVWDQKDPIVLVITLTIALLGFLIKVIWLSTYPLILGGGGGGGGGGRIIKHVHEQFTGRQYIIILTDFGIDIANHNFIIVYL